MSSVVRSVTAIMETPHEWKTAMLESGWLSDAQRCSMRSTRWGLRWMFHVAPHDWHWK